MIDNLVCAVLATDSPRAHEVSRRLVAALDALQERDAEIEKLHEFKTAYLLRSEVDESNRRAQLGDLLDEFEHEGCDTLSAVVDALQEAREETMNAADATAQVIQKAAHVEADRDRLREQLGEARLENEHLRERLSAYTEGKK